MKCSVCPNEIAQARIDAQPNTLTCSADCSKEHRRQHNNRLSRERRVAARKAREMKSESRGPARPRRPESGC